VQEYWRYGYYDEIQHFIECVGNKSTPMLTFKDGLEVNRIIDKAYASSRSGKWERLATDGESSPTTPGRDD